MDVHRAAAFLADYRRAGGPPYPQDLIVPWIRARLRREILRNRSAEAVGEYHDPEYEAMELRAFDALRDVVLPVT